jgi:oligoribonuclease (3'-5' exoribonuclease)
MLSKYNVFLFDDFETSYHHSITLCMLNFVFIYASMKCRYPIAKSKNWLFEDYGTHRHIFHYSNLLVATNIELIKYTGRPRNKNLWKLCESEHEAIHDTIRVRANPEGSLN